MMEEIIIQKRKKKRRRICTDICTYAKSKVCHCICNGVNHGINRKKEKMDLLEEGDK